MHKYACSQRTQFGTSACDSRADGRLRHQIDRMCAPHLMSAVEPAAAPGSGFELRSLLSALPRSEATKSTSSALARLALRAWPRGLPEIVLLVAVYFELRAIPPYR